MLQDYYADGSDKVPRYYQVNAVKAAIEAIAKGRDRNPAGHGDRHRQDLHCLPDHLASEVTTPTGRRLPALESP